MTSTDGWKWHYLLSALLLTAAMLCIAAVMLLEVLALVLLLSAGALT